ncbi:MAG: hypothetical protein ACOX4W_04805 [Bacilli bacterium]|jgi:hypothetical protein
MKKRFLMLFMMLLLSALVVTAAGYAWFTASAQAEIEGTQIKAETQGVLKVWTENANGVTNDYENYTTAINFAEPTDPFYNIAYTDYAMKDQSGNGSQFVEAVAAGASANYGVASGFGVALVYNLYFSAYTGNATSQMRDIFLSSLTVTNASGTLLPSVRIGFLDSNNNIYGIWAHSSGQPKYALQSQAGDPVSTAAADLDGSVVSSTAFDTTNYTDFEAGSITESTSELKYVKPAGPAASVVRRIIPSATGTASSGTSICQIDSSVIKALNPTIKVVVWIEGSDPNTDDSRLSHQVSIDMIFQSRMPADTYAITYYTNGGANNAANAPTFTAAQFNESETIGGQSYTDLRTIGVPTKPGFTFGGWFDDPGMNEGDAIMTNDAGTTWYLRPSDFAADRTIKIYAKWS